MRPLAWPGLDDDALRKVASQPNHIFSFSDPMYGTPVCCESILFIPEGSFVADQSVATCLLVWAGLVTIVWAAAAYNPCE